MANIGRGSTTVLSLVALLLATGVLTGCSTAWSARSAGAPSAVTDVRPVVLTTFTVLADLARQVAGNHLRVESITRVGAEIHGYEPTPGDLRRAADADLIVDNGLGLESWFGRFVQRLKVEHVVASTGVTPIDIAGESYAGRPNPHAWMAPSNAVIYVENLVVAFSKLDPAHAADYRTNGAAYQDQLRQLHDRLVAAVKKLPSDHRALVTCEGAFSYLAATAGLQEHYLWPVNAEQQATPQRMVRLVEAVTDRKVPAVFCESTVSPAPMQQVARAARTTLGGTLYVDSLSLPDGPVPTYLALVEHDITMIINGLSGS